MESNRKQILLAINKIPLVGILIFISLFIFSSTLYPGGSQANVNSIGFDWLHNYWCNLMNVTAMNGQLNPARAYAISAMIILCLSVMVFFIQFADFHSENMHAKRAIKFGGILSMSFAILMFTQYHDLMTIISSVFGLCVVIGIISEINNSSLTRFKISGLSCLLLLGLNNYIYYSLHGITWLPIIQKITLITILLWILGLNQEVKKKIINEYIHV